MSSKKQLSVIYGLCVISFIHASEEVSKTKWIEHNQLVLARQAYSNHNYQGALKIYQDLDKEYQKSPTDFEQRPLLLKVCGCVT
ncbi:hypothetical protein Noda2021_00090 [Candidatus Dependentiae bacterium Noda2021]|nr:hypothetical protein Noda2021_00090 [Candidatus Dependentiae bacterium Noda2021]